ncbi:MAG: hypothetical protein WCZ66_00010 [Sphingomonadaceae bacterium]
MQRPQRISQPSRANASLSHLMPLRATSRSAASRNALQEQTNIAFYFHPFRVMILPQRLIPPSIVTANDTQYPLLMQAIRNLISQHFSHPATKIQS